MPDPRGFGILVYLLFPLVLVYWLTTPTYNVCEACAGRWQRGVLVKPTRSVEIEERAGMYGGQVPTAAVVRRRTRLGGPGPSRKDLDQRDVRVVASPGCCRTCRAADGQYSASNAPTIPIVGCTCAGGCACVTVAINAELAKEADQGEGPKD